MGSNAVHCATISATHDNPRQQQRYQVPCKSCEMACSSMEDDVFKKMNASSDWVVLFCGEAKAGLGQTRPSYRFKYAHNES